MKFSAKYASEFFGTAGLLILIVGSGIMGEKLSSGNSAIALLANSIVTGAGLYVLILALKPISGAHFNPIVSIFEFLKKRLSPSDLIKYVSAQMIGGLLGVFITHAMFGQRIFQISTKNRGETGLIFSEMIATFGLIAVIHLIGQKSPDKTPAATALYIVAAYWCTSSTCFANPAVTIARALTDTFSGILLINVPAFIIGQLASLIFAYSIFKQSKTTIS